MAREHARLMCSIWRPDSEFRNRSASAQRLYFVVLSQREVNNAGVTPLMLSKWSRAAPDTTVVDVEKALAELEEHRYFVVDRDTEELLIRSYMRHDEVMKHPYMRRSALRAVEQIESPRLRLETAVELRRIGHPEGVETASRLDADASATTHRDGIPSSSSTTHRDAIESGTETTHRDGLSDDPSTTHGGRGGGRGGGRAPVPEVVQMGGEDAKPPPRNDLLEDRPAERCARHADAEPSGPCRACGDARRSAETWDVETAKARAAAVRACRWCNADGWRIDPEHPHRGPMRARCDHTPLAEHLAAVEASR